MVRWERVPLLCSRPCAVRDPGGRDASGRRDAPGRRGAASLLEWRGEGLVSKETVCWGSWLLREAVF